MVGFRRERPTASTPSNPARGARKAIGMLAIAVLVGWAFFSSSETRPRERALGRSDPLRRPDRSRRDLVRWVAFFVVPLFTIALGAGWLGYANLSGDGDAPATRSVATGGLNVFTTDPESSVAIRLDISEASAQDGAFVGIRLRFDSPNPTPFEWVAVLSGDLALDLSNAEDLCLGFGRVVGDTGPGTAECSGDLNPDLAQRYESAAEVGVALGDTLVELVRTAGYDHRQAVTVSGTSTTEHGFRITDDGLEGMRVPVEITGRLLSPLAASGNGREIGVVPPLAPGLMEEGGQSMGLAPLAPSTGRVYTVDDRTRALFQTTVIETLITTERTAFEQLVNSSPPASAVGSLVAWELSGGHSAITTWELLDDLAVESVRSRAERRGLYAGVAFSLSAAAALALIQPLLYRLARRGHAFDADEGVG